MFKLARKTDKNAENKKIISNVSSTVNVDKMPVATITSILEDGSTIITGSTTVNVQNKPVAFISSKDSKGKLIITGSNTVNIGK